MTATAAPPVDLRLARQLSGVVVVATFTVLVGWYAGLEQLTTVVPGFAAMKPNTALCLLLLALGPWAARRSLAPVMAGIVLTLASVTALELALRVHWWVDRLLPGIDLRGNDPQLAPITAACLILLSVSAMAGRGGKNRLLQTTALLALFAAYVALIGYLYGASNLYGVGAYSSIALPTAVSITLLAASQLVLAPGGTLMALLRNRGPAGSLVRSLAPALNEDLEHRVVQQTAQAHRMSARFRAAFAASPLGSALTTTDGIVEQVNARLPALQPRAWSARLGDLARPPRVADPRRRPGARRGSRPSRAVRSAQPHPRPGSHPHGPVHLGLHHLAEVPVDQVDPDALRRPFGSVIAAHVSEDLQSA